MKQLGLFNLALFLISNIAFGQTSFENWARDEFKISHRNLLNNISRPDTGKGFIVASPQKEKPDYYYHWVRDAALVMAALQKTLPQDNMKYQLFDDYIKRVQYHQKIYKLTNQGEPKFNPNGTSYQKSWGRPQNDGPALRAITLIRYALELMNAGKKSYVEKNLYRSNDPGLSTIKIDLEYVSHHWKEPSFDLWEEVMGQNFYTLYVQRTAMFLGAKIARAFNDPKAALWYEKQIEPMTQALNKHYSESKGYIRSTLNYQRGDHGKTSNLDTSVILAVLHAWQPELSFKPNDSRVIKTAQKIIEVFGKLYPINKGEKYNIGIGRYPEDIYSGGDEKVGHPWFLLTSAMAEYFYTLSQMSKKMDKNVSYLFYNIGDDFLKRVRKHVGQDAHNKGRMDEQFDKDNGYMKSARHLTWSYAAFITAYYQREFGF